MRGPPVCPKCFKSWDYIPDRSLPYSGALKAVHPVGPCVERKSVVEDLPEPPPRKPQARIEYDPRHCDICRQRYVPRQHNQVCCSPKCRGVRDAARRTTRNETFGPRPKCSIRWCKNKVLATGLCSTHYRYKMQAQAKVKREATAA